MVAHFIAGDWGTSNLRLSLCDRSGKILQTREGPGVSMLGRALVKTFEALTSDWGPALPAIFCGMAGSTLGWREVAYLSCPIHPAKIAQGALCFEAAGRDIAIAPGLSCRNRLAAPDVMRGEETQILGAFALDASLTEGTHLLCLPGTHTKWVLLRNGTIEQFQTGLAGELFDILRRHSVLVGVGDLALANSSLAFVRALAQTAEHPQADLTHLLFEVRSRQLAGELQPHEAAGYLSGLVIGQDVAGAMRQFADDLSLAPATTLIGASDLCNRYATALDMRGLSTKRMDGAAASVAGLTALHDALFRAGLAHAS
jgi:2-dehydro-3-deoxygalactonokinase